jgi:hypothetical protein
MGNDSSIFERNGAGCGTTTGEVNIRQSIGDRTLSRVLSILVGAAILSSCSEYAAPKIVYPSPESSDPIGDTFGDGDTKWDITAMTINRDASAITVRLEFASDVISPTSGDTTAMTGFVDFDTDQDSSTGIHNTIDGFRPPGAGSTGLGTDYQLKLRRYDSDSSVTVSDSHGEQTGRVKPVFDGKSVTIRIPLAMLGNDDGALDAAAIVGDLHRPSDIVPDNGHLTVGPSAAER